MIRIKQIIVNFKIWTTKKYDSREIFSDIAWKKVSTSSLQMIFMDV